MTILKILLYPDKRLRKIADPVNNIDKNTKRIIQNMLDTMYANKGIGLAATQINYHKQIIVIDTATTIEEPLIIINPLIIKKYGKISTVEGCLSIPNEYHAIQRAAKIIIKAFNQNGKFLKIEAYDLLAICIQHEMDHLIGKLFIDHLNITSKNF